MDNSPEQRELGGRFTLERTLEAGGQILRVDDRLILSLDQVIPNGAVLTVAARDSKIRFGSKVVYPKSGTAVASNLTVNKTSEIKVSGQRYKIIWTGQSGNKSSFEISSPIRFTSIREFPYGRDYPRILAAP